MSLTVPATNPQQFFRLKLFPIEGIFEYAIFYNGLLEFTWSAPQTINGCIHANGNIYTGSSADLTVNGWVTTTGTISSPAWGGHTPSQYTGTFTYSSPPITNVPPVLPFFLTNNAHLMIDFPPPGEDPTSALGGMRLANLAGIQLVISNTTVTAVIQASTNGLVPGADPAPNILICSNTPASLKTYLPFLMTTNTFTDQRENKTVLVSQIDVGQYARWTATNPFVLAKYSGAPVYYPTILYVADLRTVTSTQLAAVRLTNGIAPPVNGGLGFTLATPNPLYVWGNYNCTNAAYLASTNTSATVPCALMSDALTILSSAWQDSQSASAYSGRDPTVDTVNAAVLTGIVPSNTNNAGVPYSGGVMNLPRLLEDWANGIGVDLWMNTSIVSLFASTMATNIFQNPGAYYTPPTRHFSLDQNFLQPKLPPGTPVIRY